MADYKDAKDQDLGMNPIRQPSGASTFSVDQFDNDGETNTVVFHNVEWRRKIWQLKFNLMDTERFVTSHILPTWALLVVRVLLATYSVITVTASLAMYWNGGLWLRFFTNLSYAGLVIYLVAASIHTGLYVKQCSQGRPFSFEVQPRWLNLSYWLLYEIMFTYKVVVPIMYWLFLSSNAPAWSESLQAWNNLSVHGMDFVLIFVEFIFNRQIYVWGHVYYLLFIVLVYAIYTNILYFANPDLGWTYFFMDTTTMAALMWYPAMLMLFTLVWTLCFLATVAKEKIAAKFTGKDDGDDENPITESAFALHDVKSSGVSIEQGKLDGGK